MEYEKRRFARSDKTNDQSKPLSKPGSPKLRSSYGCSTTAVRLNQNTVQATSDSILPPFCANERYHRKGARCEKKSEVSLKTRPRNPQTPKRVEEIIQEGGSNKKSIESVMYPRSKAGSSDVFSTPSRPTVKNPEISQRENSTNGINVNSEKLKPRQSLISTPPKTSTDKSKQTEMTPISSPRKTDGKRVKECEEQSNLTKSNLCRNLGEDSDLDSRVLIPAPPYNESRLPLSQRELNRRRKRSKIPLKKNCTNLNRNEPKEVPLLVEKPKLQENTDSTTSLIPDDEYLHFFSTLQFFSDFAASTEGLIQSLDLGRAVLVEEKSENSKTSNCVEQEAASVASTEKTMDNLTTETDNLTTETDNLTTERDNLTTGKDNFSILTRLESFHQKNVSSRESAAKNTVKSLKRYTSNNKKDTKELPLNAKNPRRETKSKKGVPRKLRRVSRPKVNVSNEVLKTQRVNSMPAGRNENFKVKKNPEGTRNSEAEENFVREQGELVNIKSKLTAGTQNEEENAEIMKVPKTPVNSEISSTGLSDFEHQIDPIPMNSTCMPSRITITMQEITVHDTNEQSEEENCSQEGDQQEDIELPLADTNTEDVSTNEKPQAESPGHNSTETSKSELHQEVFINSVPFTLAKDEPPEKPQQPATAVNKEKMKLDLRVPWDAINYDSGKDTPKPDAVLTDEEQGYKVNNKSDPSGLNCLENDKEKKNNEEQVSKKTQIVEESPINGDFPEIRKSILAARGKQQLKIAINTKTKRKKKVRSGGGDRSRQLTTALFNSQKNKPKPDAKLRSGLTKPSKREDLRDVFEDSALMKLRRRNSEPNSFRGFVWKCTDCLISRGQEASVSSLTSSLRHLNTDEIDDFILWEAIPQRMTSCWEMSLYNFKRPWSVLSCSVFKHNRKSSTPGLILENLRNGGLPNTRQSAVIRSDTVTFRKGNPFDVEPSVAQKNIDIRNWLAALNFPTTPSTSTEVFTEGSFFSEPSIGKNLKKATLRRRKMLPNLKAYEETPKKRNEDREKPEKTPKPTGDGGKSLTKLSRRRPIGFPRKEQILINEHPIRRPNVTVNLCVYSESFKESILLESDKEKKSCCELTKYKSKERAVPPEPPTTTTVSGHLEGQTVNKGSPRDEQERTEEEGCSTGGFLKEELSRCLSNGNFWKYLFVLTISIIITHYYFFNSFTYYD